MSIDQSILSLYFSKEHLGITHFSAQSYATQCSQLSYPIYATQILMAQLCRDRNVTLIITNNDTHKYLSMVPQEIKVIRINQKGLKDDIIESNLSMLRVNPINSSIRNREMFIKQMFLESERVSAEKEKIRSLGAILYYLFNEGHFRIKQRVFLDEIEFFQDKILHNVIVTQIEFESLEIVKEQIHPSFIKGKGRSKQGFSVLNLYQSTLISQNAKKILRNIFHNPTQSQSTIQQRVKLISWITNNFNDQPTFIKIFKSIHSLPTILKKFQDSRVELEDWRKLANTMEAILLLSKLISERGHFSTEEFPTIITNFIEKVDWGQISSVLLTITATLDLKQGGIKRGVNKKLDDLKKVYDDLPHLLTIYAQEQNWEKDLRIVFITQVGYLIKVPLEIQLISEFQQEWGLQFTNSSGRYYCNSLTEMLDQEYGDIYGEITDREKKIIFDLQTIVCEISDKIQDGFWMASEIECYWGVTIASKGMCYPRLSSESLIIAGGWHILLAQDAIDNNAFSFNHEVGPTHRVYNSQQNIVNTNYSNRVMIISGPNASGKTIFMKQTAIIIYLAHLGFPVPADFAEVPLIDRIVMVEPTQSLYQEINGFESEIMSLSRITTPGMITNKSLVLIDELGASINTEISMKIFGATIKYLSDNEDSGIKINENLSVFKDKFKIPLCIMITHLTEMIGTKIVEQNYYVRFLTMSMEKDKICLYKIRPGLVKKGYGIDCARSILGPEVIERALTYWDEIKNKG